VNDDIRTWDIAKLDIKPGNILLIRYTRPTLPGVNGPVPVSGPDLDRTLQSAEDIFRILLDRAGITADMVPVLAMTEEWDIASINPLDLLNVCATAARAGDKP